MESARETRNDARRWWLAVLGLVPLILLLVAPALGIMVPLPIYLLVLLWSVLMLVWNGRLRAEGAVAAATSGAAGATVTAQDLVPALPTAVPKARPWLNVLLLVATLVPRRRLLAWVSFALLGLILLPFPHALSPGFGVHCPYV